MSRRSDLTPMENADLDHPTVETFVRFRQDDYLREIGFRIHSRPRRGEALWERAGQVVPQSKAIESVGREMGLDVQRL